MTLRNEIDPILDAADKRIAELSADLQQTTADLAQSEAELVQVQSEFGEYVASHAHLGPSPSPTPPTPTPLPPAAKASLVAVRVFPHYVGKVYDQHDAVLARLGDLGVERISHQINPKMTQRTIDFTRRAYEMYGIKSWCTTGAPRELLSEASWDWMEGILAGPWKGMIERLYGWNEPNHVRGGKTPLPANWPQMTALHQNELWTRAKPLDILVGTPQLWSGTLDQHDADLTKLAPFLTGLFDHIGWHLYPRSGGAENEKNIARFDAIYKRLLGTGYQVVCTEAGYTDAVNYTGGSQNNTPAEKAILTPLLLDAYVKRGYGISYFELCDDPDPTESDREANLGLVECKSTDPRTWVNKLAFGTTKKYLAA